MGNNPNSILKIKDALTDKGYQVDLVNLSVDPEEAFRRRVFRFLQTGRIPQPFRERDKPSLNNPEHDAASDKYMDLTHKKWEEERRHRETLDEPTRAALDKARDLAFKKRAEEVWRRSTGAGYIIGGQRPSGTKDR